MRPQLLDSRKKKKVKAWGKKKSAFQKGISRGKEGVKPFRQTDRQSAPAPADRIKVLLALTLPHVTPPHTGEQETEFLCSKIFPGTQAAISQYHQWCWATSNLRKSSPTTSWCSKTPQPWTEELWGQKKIMGTTNQSTGIIYITYNLGTCNNKTEIISVSLRTIEWLYICWRLYWPHGKHRFTLDLNRTRFWQLTINYTHGLMSQCRKKNASPNQTQAELYKALSPSARPAPFPLIHECAHAGAGEEGREEFLYIKKKQQPHSWAAVAMGPRGSQQMAGEPSLRPALKPSTQACHSHSPHSGGTWPRRRAAGPRDTAPPSPLPEVPEPGCEEQREEKSCRDTGFRYWEFHCLGECGLLAGSVSASL